MTRNEILILFPPETLPTGRVDTMLGFCLEFELQDHTGGHEPVKSR